MGKHVWGHFEYDGDVRYMFGVIISMMVVVNGRDTLKSGIELDKIFLVNHLKLNITSHGVQPSEVHYCIDIRTHRRLVRWWRRCQRRYIQPAERHYWR